MKYISHQTKICSNGKHPLNFIDFEMLSTKIWVFFFLVKHCIWAYCSILDSGEILKRH